MQDANAAPVEELEQDTEAQKDTRQRVRIDRNRVELVMRERGFTNMSLAEKIGKHYNSILRLKKVQSMPLDELGELCDALECHPFDLIVAEGFPEPFSHAPASR
jgi:DNA-binding Xre family transcriptional regulator